MQSHARDVAETMAGLLAGHAAGLTLMLLLSWAQTLGILGAEAVALYPPLAALVGASAVASLSRATGLSLLGSWGSREALLEASGLLAAGLIAAATAAPLALWGWSSWPEWAPAAALAALAGVASVAPLLALAARAPRLPVNLDNIAPSAATSIVDLAVLGGLIAFSGSPGSGAAWLLALWTGLTLLLALRRLHYSPAGLSTAALGVLALEALTGRLLGAGYQLLSAASLLHVAPSILKAAGGAAASSAARSSSIALLSGPEAVQPLREAVKAAASTIPSGVIIGVAGALASPGSLATPLLAAPLATPITALASALLGAALVKASSRASIDPDRSVVPLVTAIADLVGVLVLLAAAFALA